MSNVSKNKIVDITPLFVKAGIHVPELTIEETPEMYPYKEKVEDNWAYYTAVGLKRLRELLDGEGRKVRDAGIIGICSGVEGIALVQVFRDTIRQLIVTDVERNILKGTAKNIHDGTKMNTIYQLLTLFGSFSEPIEAAAFKMDLVHGNIPNLPASATQDLSRGAEKGTFVPADLYEGYDPPQTYINWALAAQYAYMQSSLPVLRKDGSFVTELGGRVPLELVKQMFDEGGLDMSELIVGFKEQTEALIDFEGYHRLERQHDVTFDFYKYDESRAFLDKHGFKNPTWEISGEEVKQMLEEFKVSSGQALQGYNRGRPYGHTVHLFRGTRRGA